MLDQIGAISKGDLKLKGDTLETKKKQEKTAQCQKTSKGSA